METEQDSLAVQFAKLVDRSYTTYQSRVHASERLARLSATWNVALVVGTLAATIDSVVLLVDKSALGPRGDVVLTCASILTLFISVAISGMNLSGKSRDMFTSYRRIQRLSSEVERTAASRPSVEALFRLAGEYDDLLDNSENHRFCDFLKAEPARRTRPWQGRSNLLATVPPIAFVAASIALASPAINWMF